MVAKIYKARYFPQIDFLESKIGSSLSYIWQSVWESREIIKAGTQWRVGDGKSINIWEDSWLPDGGEWRIQSERPSSLGNN